MNRFVKGKSTEIVDCLTSWDLQNAVKKADDEIIVQKNAIKAEKIGNQSTDKYKSYLEAINENILIALGNDQDEGTQSPSPKKTKTTHPN